MVLTVVGDSLIDLSIQMNCQIRDYRQRPLSGNQNRLRRTTAIVDDDPARRREISIEPRRQYGATVDLNRYLYQTVDELGGMGF
jgi:hypothetical protein